MFPKKDKMAQDVELLRTEFIEFRKNFEENLEIVDEYKKPFWFLVFLNLFWILLAFFSDVDSSAQKLAEWNFLCGDSGEFDCSINIQSHN